MRFARLAATASLLLGAFCPLGAHTLIHAIDSAHVHRHADGTVHAHEHEHGAQGDHHEVRDADAEPRIAVSGTRFVPGPRIEWRAPAAAPSVAPFAPSLIGAASLDPPLLLPQSLVAPPSAGRAPPA